MMNNSNFIVTLLSVLLTCLTSSLFGQVNDENFDALASSLRGLDYSVSGIRFEQITPNSISQMATLSENSTFIITPVDNDKGLLYNIDNSGNVSGPNVGAFDYRFRSEDGSEFKINSMEADMSANNPANGYVFRATVTGYRNGISVASDFIDFTVSDATGSVTYAKDANPAANGGTLTFSSAFENIDEVRFTGGSSASISLLMIDELNFSDAVLPVDMKFFRGRISEKKVILTWETASELDNEKFEIEESRNGGDFQKVGEVQGQNTTLEQQTYSFEVEKAKNGISYYRLKQVDYDGVFEYSEVLSLHYSGDHQEAGAFYPNPSTSGIVHLNYTARNEKEIKISVFDMTGKLVANNIRQVFPGGNDLAFDFSSLRTGSYVVRFDDDRNQTHRKLIIE